MSLTSISCGSWSSMRDELSIRAQTELGRFLGSQEWDCWFTATSAKKLRYPRQAIALVSDSISGLASRYFVGAERHYLGGWHAHGLVKFYGEKQHFSSQPQSKDISSQRFLELRFSRRGFCRVEECKDQAKVSKYVSKYITKDLDSDWDFYGFKDWQSLD